ncbi:autotransporter outer membrane beta-barrel domain-containing protein [Jeongeupia naejangsanensis]|uniref:Autotransporter outer membrane beta-barrel domain-containing protein n=1 Tax=Jeongeupia naejangsanensis TaxID=613195 RepID=A0ABS2BHT3_9NEIS|nr:autotransporter outer membrane beta-barrel domain-containing protein [Jeongeupia naejangsanensis]MBM3115173.1 autotransporter outer membrane beta-barrel domain-containing protein [Jeongeupia naejangsanensis]
MPSDLPADQANRTRTYTEGYQAYRRPCPASPDQVPSVVVKQPLDCIRTDDRAAQNLNGGEALPPTPGREVDASSGWNVWVDNNYTDISDRRYGFDLDGSSYGLTLGADRLLDNGLIVGGMLGMQNSRSKQFDGDMQLKSNGYNLGPYVAYPYAENWVADASVTFGQNNNEQRILMFSGDYTTTTWGFSLNNTGQFRYDDVYLRPRMSLYYGHTRSASYQMQGWLKDRQWVFDNDGSSANYGYVEFGSEFNRTFESDNGMRWMPYADVALKYEFERANDGMILTGNLSYAEASPWSGSTHAGVRMMWSNATMLEASVGYESLGQGDLDIWSGRLYLSHGF